MTVQQATQCLEAEILTQSDTSQIDLNSACGADLMSDVMAFVKDRVLLLTGLINIQVIKTANLLDIEVICFVRGKQPSEEMINLANELGIILLKTKLPLFLACGKLYEAGLRKGGIRKIE